MSEQADFDRRTLAEMGYQQQLHRWMSGFSNFVVTSIAVVVVAIFAVVSWFVGGKNNFMRGAVDEHMTRAHSDVFEEA